MSQGDLSEIKKEVFTFCLHYLDEKIVNLRAILKELSDSVENETKSSAGDKHETARAMLHIEQEKISAQLNELLRQRTELKSIDIKTGPSKAGKGSLVMTNHGLLFLSIAIGRIIVKENIVVVLSVNSPLGIKLIGLNKGEEAIFNGTSYFIEEVC
jgi:transcription elongation GreA/GreB family factor